jgi:hypothetical protein
MEEHACETCRMRGYYEENPASLRGRLWRWHIKWCPGWKSYFESLSDEEKAQLAESLKLPSS